MTLKIPAKVILFGEHSIVYPDSSAVISSLDLYTTINTKLNNSDNITLDIKTNDDSTSVLFPLEEAKKSYELAKCLYQKYIETNEISPLKNLMTENLGAYKIIFGFVSSLIEVKGVTMKIDINAPIGSGMGTSASISSGIIYSLYKISKTKLSKEKLFELTKNIENFQHGNSSGIDPAGVINGGIQFFEHNINGKKNFTRITPKTNWDKDLYLIYSGKPVESTGEMVNKVKKLYLEKTPFVLSVFNKIKNISLKFLKNDYIEIGDLIDENGLLLEKLNIVSKNVIEFSDKIRQNGGFIKVCGAGGESGNSSGLLLCKIRNKNILMQLINEYHFKLINAKFNVPGIN